MLVQTQEIDFMTFLWAFTSNVKSNAINLCCESLLASEKQSQSFRILVGYFPFVEWLSLVNENNFGFQTNIYVMCIKIHLNYLFWTIFHSLPLPMNILGICAENSKKMRARIYKFYPATYKSGQRMTEFLNATESQRG